MALRNGHLSPTSDYLLSILCEAFLEDSLDFPPPLLSSRIKILDIYNSNTLELSPFWLRGLM